MLDGEGSVEVDGEGFEEDTQNENEGEETQDNSEHIDNQEDSKEDSTKEGEEEASSEEGEQSQETEEGKEEGEEEEQVTDKGTKLDSDPLTAANQLRANAEAKAKEYEEFFSDPKNVKAYLADLEKETDTGEEEEDLIDDPSKIETTEDLRSYAKFLDKKVERAVNGITGYVKKSEAQKEREATVSNIGNDIKSVQSEYTELRPRNADGTPNPDFDPDLERELGEMIHELDFNPNIVNPDGSKGNYMGRVSYKKLADRFMKAARRGETTGSKKAQTIIKDKRTGRIKGNSAGGNNQPDESNMTASQMIASRMARVRGK